MTRFVAMHIEPLDGVRRMWLPEGTPVPDAIFQVAGDLTGQHFLHLSRALPFDRGHDWGVTGGRVHLSPAVREGLDLVLRYGPEPTCGACSGSLFMGCRYCPHCGTETASIVEAADPIKEGA